MAIAFDAASSSGNKTTASYSWSHTVTGSNLILIVGVSSSSFPAAVVSGITYNGVALTKIRNDQSGSSDTTELWYLVAPATGANTVVVTLAAIPGASFGGAISLTGVDQVSPIDAQGGNTGMGGGTPSVVVTTVANNAWLVGAAGANNSNSAITVTAPATRQYVSNVFVGAAAAGFTQGPVSPAGTTTVNMTCNVANPWVVSAASFVPASGGGSPIVHGVPLIGRVR